MRIIDCKQGSEEWERWRNRPTASEFGRVITPKRGDYSAQAPAYAAKIVAKQLGVYVEPPPSYWMEWGTEHEPNARAWYEETRGVDVHQVGFALPDDTDSYGGSPDGLVGVQGLVEFKCPAPETLIAIHQAGVVDAKYMPQIQGLLMITGREWCDFVAWHPELTPFVREVEADTEYQAKIADGLLLLLDDIKSLLGKVSRCRHKLVSIGTAQDNVKWTQ